MVIQCVCGAQRRVADDGPPRIDWCPDCGTGASVPPPQRDMRGDGLFNDPMANYAGDRLASQDQWLFEAGLRLEWIHKHASSAATVLELGAATGEFVSVAERAGHPVVGLEPSTWAANAAAQLTAQVQETDLTDWRAQHPGETFDVIVLFHVLEHVERPGDLLREMLEVATPTSRLFVEVPNGASSAARSDNADWWAASLADHFFHFSPAGIRALMTASGWQVASARELALDTYAPRPAPYLLRAGRDLLRPLFGRGRHSKDLLRVVAKPA